MRAQRVTGPATLTPGTRHADERVRECILGVGGVTDARAAQDGLVTLSTTGEYNPG
jgi:hypothetical protein